MVSALLPGSVQLGSWTEAPFSPPLKMKYLLRISSGTGWGWVGGGAARIYRCRLKTQGHDS